MSGTETEGLDRREVTSSHNWELQTVGSNVLRRAPVSEVSVQGIYFQVVCVF